MNGFKIIAPYNKYLNSKILSYKKCDLETFPWMCDIIMVSFLYHFILAVTYHSTNTALCCLTSVI
jgi:hypothetical protein